MFIWTSIAHMALPLGEAGISEIPNEPAVLAAMQTSIGDQTGLYIFPGLGVGTNATREEKNEAMNQEAEKIAAVLRVFLFIMRRAVRSHSAKRSESNSSPNWSKRFSVVFLLAQTRITSFVGRVGFVLVAGILAAIATNVSYGIGTAFPVVYTASYMFTQIVGFLCVGIVAALVLRKERSLRKAS